MAITAKDGTRKAETPTLLRVVPNGRSQETIRVVDFQRHRAGIQRSRRLMGAIFFVDMVGYSRQMHENESTAYAARSRYRHALSIALRLHRGEVVQHYGDGALALFQSAVEAARAAVEIQRRLHGDGGVQVRIGIHVADVVRDREGVYGDGVNVAARIQALCPAGGVLVSERVRRELESHRGLETKRLGTFELKNIREPMPVHGVVHPAVAEPSCVTPAAARRWGRHGRWTIATVAATIGLVAGALLGAGLLP